MRGENKIRRIRKDDLGSLKEIIDANELFPSELLEDMTVDYFNNSETTDIWLTMEKDGIAVAVAYCAPERMTEGTYNLYLIAVHPDRQGQGIGSQLMNYIETMLLNKSVRILIVETSGFPEFEQTRKFYDQCGYAREAVIREFYAEGDDKVIFWKKLI